MVMSRKLVPSALHAVWLSTPVFVLISVAAAGTSKRFQQYHGFLPALEDVGLPLKSVTDVVSGRRCSQLCVGEQDCAVAVYTPSTLQCDLYSCDNQILTIQQTGDATLLVDVLKVHVPDGGELGFWPLTQATDTQDYSGQGKHGTNLYEVSFDGEGAVFPQGLNARFQVPEYSGVVENFSWYGRVYVQASSMTGPIFAFHTGTHIWVFQGAFHIMVIYNSCTTLTFNSPALTVGAWHTLSMSYDHAVNTLRAYVDHTEHIIEGVACVNDLKASGDIYVGTTLGANSGWGNFYGKVTCMGYYDHVVPDIAARAMSQVSHFCANN